MIWILFFIHDQHALSDKDRSKKIFLFMMDFGALLISTLLHIFLNCVMAYFYCLLHCPFLYTLHSNNLSWTPGIDLIIYWQCVNPCWRLYFRKQGMISRTTDMNIRPYTRKFGTSIFDYSTFIQYIRYLGQDKSFHILIEIQNLCVTINIITTRYVVVLYFVISRKKNVIQMFRSIHKFNRHVHTKRD